jgi:hypothetical protein
LLTGNISSIIQGTPSGTLIAAEEAPWFNNQGTRVRTLNWGLQVGRTFARTINSCFLRLDSNHLELVSEWVALVNDPGYAAAQRLPCDNRPVHLVGDQDPLNALLGSTRFSHLPIRLLRNGREIAQCFEEDGYRVCDRIRRAFRSLPAVVHSQGEKPWRKRMNDSMPLYLDLSPYKAAAMEYAGALPEVAEWARPSRLWARVFDALAFHDPGLRGLPLAAFRSTYRIVGRTARKLARTARGGQVVSGGRQSEALN